MAATYTSLSEQFVASRYPLISLSPVNGLSTYRDITSNSGGGSVGPNVTLGEITVDSGTTAGGLALLQTAEYGQVTGTDGIMVLIGLRTSGAPSGSEAGLWGYFDATDGFGFGINATSPYIFSRLNSADTIVHQASWNIDKLDGTGGSSLTLDPTKSNIYKIDFTLSGTVTFSVILGGANGVSTTVVAHSLVQNTPASASMNCPISVESLNGSTAASFKLNVGSRELNILTNQSTKPSNRLNSSLVGSLQFHAGSFTNILNIQKKSTIMFPNVNAYFHSIDMYAFAPLFVQIVANTVLSGPTWTAPNGSKGSESACQVDVASTLAAGTFVIAQFMVPTGYSSTPIHSGLSLIANGQNYSVFARGLYATTSGSCVVNWTENW